MLLALAYLESKNVVHRDIKSANILVTPDGTVKLCDFGLARVVYDKNHQLTPRVVTRWYRAPELLMLDNYYSYPVDMWATGCVIAEVLS
jgi:serine/threonine protein kinase